MPPTPTPFARFLARGSGQAARSGQYPNSAQPGNSRFDIPVVVTASNFSTHGARSPTDAPAGINTDDGPPQDRQSSTNLSAGPSSSNPIPSSRDNGAANHTNTLASSTDDDHVMPDADDGVAAPEESGLAEGGTNGESAPETSRSETVDCDEARSTSELSSEPPAKTTRKPATGTRKPVSKFHTTTPRETAPRKAATRKVAPEKAAPSQAATPQDTPAKSEPANAKGSKQTLKSELFATKSYAESQSLRPTRPIFKSSKSHDYSGALSSTSTVIPCGSQEVQDLLPLLGDLAPHLQQLDFKLGEDHKTIDKQIAAGFKKSHDENDDEIEKAKKGTKARQNKDQMVRYNGLNKNLKPLDKIDDIFLDLTENALKNGLADFLESFGSERLKVCTICSGTESPLLALQMIQESLKNRSAFDLEIEHQFSCEIEPFKQAYIQRNFDPAILFRDALDLKEEAAHTAFGGEQPIPNDADILIAGSSCIDYSGLSNRQKQFGTPGESQRTLEAVVDFAKAHRTKIVILENILNFAWAQVENMWHEAGYATQVALLDSKDFYLPQTRQRGYMIGISRGAIRDWNADFDADAAVKQWFESLSKLQRRASSPFTDFIFADDDVQLQEHKREAAVVLAAGQTNDWKKCRVEVLSYRACNFLGFKRPFTDWENNGSCHVPDFCFKLWFKRQVERVWDTADINHLRSIAERFYDFAYKFRIIDYSQSCARETDNAAWGQVRCITPSSNPYHSYRGGPLVGAEALILQGIPREKLLLNRESSKQLVDLAGNAMTSTVVGAAILAALISCGKILTKAPDRPKKSLKSPGESLRFTVRLEYDPKWQLEKTDLTVHPRSRITADEIRSLAVATMRLCSCESLICNASQIFQQCSRCGHTSCVSCGIKPKHHYTTIGPLMNRKYATDFESRIREALPPRLAIRGIFTAHLEAASASHARLGREYTVAIKAAAAGECRLVSVKRDQGLSVVYEGHHSRLVLTCERKWDRRVLRGEAFDKLTSAMALQWRFFVKPCPELPANSQIRKELQHPIARLTCLESLFEGRWEVRATPEESFALEITGSGDKVPSWEKRQGLEDPLFKNSFVWPTLEVRIPAGSSLPTANIPEQIFGKYHLLQDCGTACGSLHVKQKTSVSDTEEPLFLFLDPDPLANASYDSFVFANQHHRLGIKEVRVSLAKIKAGWRPLGTNKVSRVTCQVSSEWVPVDNVRLSEHAPNDLQKVYLAPPENVLPVNGPSCDNFGVPVVYCEFSTTKEEYNELALKSQERIGLVKNPFSLKPLSWLLKKIGHALKLTEWERFPLPTQISSRCEICAPTPPGVVWQSVGPERDPYIRPHENMLEACKYERNVKEAPEAATAQVSYGDDSALAALKVNFNVLNLIHKAVTALSDSRSSFSAPSTIHWRAVVDHGYNYPVPFPQIQLKDCQDHSAASQPPSFRAHDRELNESQLRSLGWMIGQEKQPGKLWEEQEIAEALISPMSLRLEAKVTARRHVSGGVLADDVGYGKTALVLALIDSDFQKMEAMSPPAFTPGADDMVKLNATLILTPANLTKQWRDEIEKFMGNTYNVLVLTKNNFAEKSRISTFQEADIILATWDLFDDAYFAKLAQMSRARFTPASAGRGFEEWFRMAQQDLKTLIKNSHGLKADRLSSAWYGLEENKYKKFAGFSKRNKKGGEDEPAPKKSRTREPEFDNVEIEVPTAPYLPLHACIFRRIVVDEFTYVGDKQLPAIFAFQAIRRWILSGTPPINTFEGASSMANFLGTTIGVPDDAALRYRKVKSSKVTHVTTGELFRSWATIHTPSWYMERNAVAEAFIHGFTRKNTADVRGIQKFDHYQKINLAAFERATYFETFLLIVNRGIKMMGSASGRKASQEEADNPSKSRTERINKHIAASELPEDALITLCSTMPSFAITRQPAATACDGTIMDKEDFIVKKVHSLLSELRGAFWIMSTYADEIARIPDIYNYLRSVQENRFGDTTVRELVNRIIAHAKETQGWTVAEKIEESRTNQYTLRNDSTKAPDSLLPESRVAELKLRADTLTESTIELTALVRERRFFIETKSCLAANEIECSSCGHRTNDYSKIVLMGRCGHAGCKQCLEKSDGTGPHSDECFDRYCSSKSPLSSMIEASDLTNAAPSDLIKQHGSKMVAITELLSRIPVGEKVLVFVQFGRIMTALKAVLRASDIEFADTSDIKTAADEVDKFRSNVNHNVCLLQLDSPNAAGWNLQAANHVVFVSTLVAKNQHEYKSSLTQAIGRVLRLGQKKDVHVYYFVAGKTIEVNILEERRERVLVERKGEFLLVEEREILPSDSRPFGGLPFQGAVYGGGGGEEEN